jgi:hypothetical protein
MNAIGKNEELLKNIVLKKLYLISSTLLDVKIFTEDYKVVIELGFKLLSGGEIMRIKFVDVSEYLFYYRNNYGFYDVATCKFFKKDDLYYLSLDPYDETLEMHPEDQDFILCKEIEGFISE